MPDDIFISYRRSDEAQARVLHEHLKARGIGAWYDAELPAGEDWRKATAKALVDARIFVLLFSRSASNSDDIAKELAAATFQKKLIIPVRIEAVQPEGAFLYELAARNWFDAFENTDARLATLADQLAEIVKHGPSPELKALHLGATGVNPAYVPPDRTGLVPGALAGGGIVAAALVLVWAVSFMDRPTALVQQHVLPIQRIAFFGISAEGSDANASEIARAATDQMFQTMGALRFDVAARTETLDTAVAQRFGRATKLGALYALSGDVRIARNQATLSVRFEDIPTHTMLWQQSFSAPMTEASQLPMQVAYRTNQTLRCIIDWVRPQLTRDNAQFLKLSADACRAGGYADYTDDFLVRTRALADSEPGSGFFQTLLASAIIFSTETAPDQAGATRIAEAERVVRKAAELDPKTPWVILSQLALAQAKKAPMTEMETRLSGALAKLEGKDAFSYSQVNMMYGSLASSAGRWGDALAYWNVASSTDPLQSTFYIAFLHAMQGKADLARREFEMELARYPSAALWNAWVAMAIFLGTDDAEKVMQSTPSFVPATAVDCWSVIRKAYVSGNRKAKKSAASLAFDCNRQGIIESDVALVTIAALGDLDLAFDVAEVMGVPNEALFWPTSAAMRADKRFLPLVERLGLMAYWKSSKSKPEVCFAESVPFCLALGRPERTP
ncbi:MAG: toll/interleukin-1 receptor domain-containing protein [Micropepsaceae bacterium]